MLRQGHKPYLHEFADRRRQTVESVSRFDPVLFDQMLTGLCPMGRSCGVSRYAPVATIASPVGDKADFIQNRFTTSQVVPVGESFKTTPLVSTSAGENPIGFGKVFGIWPARSAIIDTISASSTPTPAVKKAFGSPETAEAPSGQDADFVRLLQMPNQTTQPLLGR
jgi:hypothetical protein